MKKLFFLLLSLNCLFASAQQDSLQQPALPIFFPIDSSAVGIMPKIIINRWQDSTNVGSNIYYQTTYHSELLVEGRYNQVIVYYQIETVELVDGKYKVIKSANRSTVITREQFAMSMLNNPAAAAPFISGLIINPVALNIHLNTVSRGIAPQNSLLMQPEGLQIYMNQNQNNE